MRRVSLENLAEDGYLRVTLLNRHVDVERLGPNNNLPGGCGAPHLRRLHFALVVEHHGCKQRLDVQFFLYNLKFKKVCSRAIRKLQDVLVKHWTERILQD